MSGSELRAAWESFCEDLKQAGAVLERPETPGDAQTGAEALRYLTRMLRAGLENTLELADPRAPWLVPMVGPTLQYEGVTSDARYLHTFIDGSASHRISGSRGDAPLIEFGIYTGKMGMHEKSHLISSVTEEALEVGADGRVELFLGPEPHSGNWIRTDAETRYVMIRQYAPDWAGLVAGQFQIERADAVEPPPIQAAELRQALGRCADFVCGNPVLWAKISDYWKDEVRNRIVPEGANEMTDIAPPSGHRFSCGYFDLEADEALELRFSPAGAGFWSLGVANYWYETIGYGRRESHLNSGHSVLEADGSVRAVISRERPPEGAGVSNWIDTRGHREGTVVFRWSRSARPAPEIASRVVPLRAL